MEGGREDNMEENIKFYSEIYVQIIYCINKKGLIIKENKFNFNKFKKLVLELKSKNVFDSILNKYNKFDENELKLILIGIMKIIINRFKGIVEDTQETSQNYSEEYKAALADIKHNSLREIQKFEELISKNQFENIISEIKKSNIRYDPKFFHLFSERNNKRT